MPPASENEERDTQTERTKRFSGFDARFGTDPNELYIERRAGSPAYIRLQTGDYLQEGDAFYREQLGMDSPTLATWEVTDITASTITGRERESGEEVTWDRSEVEKGLALGRYSTNLTDFESLSVYQVGTRSDEEDDDDAASPYYTGPPYVAVVAYGDNGTKYGRRYRFLEPESNELTVWQQDQPRGEFSEAVADRLDRRVREALEAEGYTVNESSGD